MGGDPGRQGARTERRSGQGEGVLFLNSTRPATFRVAEIEAPAAAEDGLSGWLWTQGALGVEIVEQAKGLLLRAYFPTSASGEGPVASNTVLADSLASRRRTLGRHAALLVRTAGRRLAGSISRRGPAVRGRGSLPARSAGGGCTAGSGRRAHSSAAPGTHRLRNRNTRLDLPRPAVARERGPGREDGPGRRYRDGCPGLRRPGAGAASAVAFDIDPASPFSARANRTLNLVAAVRIFAGTFAAISPALRVQVALNNVVPEETLPYLKLLSGAVEPGGVAIFSGVLAGEAEGWVEELAAAGFRETHRLAEEEWVAIRTERARLSEATHLVSPDALGGDRADGRRRRLPPSLSFAAPRGRRPAAARRRRGSRPLGADRIGRSAQRRGGARRAGAGSRAGP